MNNILIDYTNLSIILGGVAGFVVFITSLEASGMGNIIIRQGEFAPQNIIHFMKSPFKEKFLWYPALWRSNWVIMTSVGLCIGKFVSYLVI